MGKRPTGSSVDWQMRRLTIATDVLDLYLEKPWPNVSIEDIAERLSVSYWQVYYSFDGQADIYRAAIGRLIDTIAAKITVTPGIRPSVNQTIQHYVRYAADVVDSDAYQKLLFLCLRDEHTDPWVKSAYENRIAEPLRQGLEDAVSRAGDDNDLKLIMLHDVRDRYLTMLEATLALPKLLNHGKFVVQNFEQTVSATAKHIFQSTCTFDGFGSDKPRNNASLAA